MPTDYLSLRLDVLDRVRDADGARGAADYLEGEAQLISDWSTQRWLEEGARWARLRSAAVADPRVELGDYLFGTLMPIALDPAARMQMIVADQVVAAVLRGAYLCGNA